MSNRFVTLAIEWNNIPDRLVPGPISKCDEERDELVQTSDGRDEDGATNFEETFSQLLNSLLLVQKVPLALESYANRLADSIRLIVRTCLLEYINADVTARDDSQSSGATNETSFSDKVRSMTNENFLSCLQMSLESLLQSLRRSVAVHVFICQVYAKEISHSVASDDDEEVAKVDGDVTDEDKTSSLGADLVAAQLWAVERSGSVLTSMSDLAQKSICQLLLMRKESTAKLPLDQMKFLWDMVLNFVYTVDKFNNVLLELDLDSNDDNDEKEDQPVSPIMHAAVVNLSTFPLRNGLLNQTKKFLEYLHETYKSKLVNSLDNEKWIQCDVSPERQAVVDVLTSGRSTIVKKELAPETTSVNGAAVGAKSKKKELVPVMVNGNAYKIVWSALYLVEIVMSYLDVAVQFAPITKEVISKTVDIVNLFDSRSKQLVLGAQAIQSASRLKSIAAKHLGIMAQSLTFLSAIIPHLRAAFLTLLPPEHHLVLVEVDRVSKNIHEHHSKVLQKFVSIVGDFVDVSSQKLVVLDWDRFNGQSEYFEEVCRNVSALHRVLLVSFVM